MDSRRVGVLGGGQLGRMMAEAGHRLGIQLAILDPAGSDSPAGQVATLSIEGSFRDEAKVRELAAVSDVLTVEIEHVNCDALEAVMSSGTPVQPLPSTVRTIQDKYQQKVYLQQHGIPLPDFRDVPDLSAAYEAGRVFGYPLMLKAKTMAYDGKGNAVAKTEADVKDAFELLAKTGGVYAEKWADFTKELAVMVVRSDKEVKPYPVVETVQKDNICHTCIVPAIVPPSAYAQASDISSRAIGVLHGQGIFGVELFLLRDGSVVLNEIAPRPHNSGHYTMEACETDQFENHLRAVLGLPLGGTALRVGACVMLNILGEGSMDETKALVSKALSVPGAGVHWYGKAEAKKGRKMAHITFTADSFRELKQRVAPFGLLTDLTTAPPVGIIMGSDSDLPTMKDAAEVLDQFGVAYELTVVSAHRTPTRMYEYAQTAAARGVQVIIAGAGGAAHLPGMVAALTSLPVIGVPVKTSTLSGVDSLYSIVQMPKGIPVATVAIGNAANAGLLAVRTLAASDPVLLAKVEAFNAKQEGEVLNKATRLEAIGWQAYLAPK